MSFRFLLRVLVSALILAAGPALAGSVISVGAIEVIDPFARATLPNSPTGGVYFTLSNTGTTDDRLVSASSPLADEVQMHEVSVVDTVAKMRQLTDGITIPAGGSVVLEPSGLHLMLTHLAHPLRQGETVSITLVFETAGAVTIDAPIGSIAARAAP